MEKNLIHEQIRSALAELIAEFKNTVFSSSEELVWALNEEMHSFFNGMELHNATPRIAEDYAIMHSTSYSIDKKSGALTSDVGTFLGRWEKTDDGWVPVNIRAYYAPTAISHRDAQELLWA